MQNQANGRASDYLPNESEFNANTHANGRANGNGHANGHANGNGNGNGKTPAEKAWQTARDKAAAEARTPFEHQLDEELRALTDPALPDGAARLFLLIVKLSWQPFQGGRFKGQLGALAISARKLAAKVGCNVKAFYSKKDKRTGARRPGWIELLVQGGYVWLGRHRIPNIPENKSLNVYNVSIHVPRYAQGSLPWTDGSWGGEVTIAEEEATWGEGEETLAGEGGGTVPRNGHSDFSAQNPAGNTESPEKGTACPPQGALPVPPRGNSPSPATGIARPPQRARAVPRNGHRLSPATGTGCSPSGERAVPRNGHRQSPATGHKEETLEPQKALKTSRGVGEAPPEDWDREFSRWKFSLERKFDRELRATLDDLKAQRDRVKESTDTPPDDRKEKLRRLRLKIEAVNVKLNGPQ
jgi:hypothetical protein